MKVTASILVTGILLAGCGANNPPRNSDGSAAVRIDQLGPNLFQTGSEGFATSAACYQIVFAEVAKRHCVPAGKTAVNVDDRYDIQRAAGGFAGFTYTCTATVKCE